ncbi:TetR/AcrR family transcriptional regulator [Actinoplanes sp. NPDC051633]|uniref:TetR/AcrR family transcriptional regulator n=1 Tax=Actinoplanes sp. NPDC051633 TaxID=3155670 RepID=UPI00342C2489
MTVTNSDAEEQPSPGGSRQQQKEQTRRRIAATAMQLFAERGFSQVTVAEVADAAGVTEKTVFNHFASKEDLVYAQDQAFETALLDAVTSRPPGISAFDAVRTFLLSTYARFPGEAAVQRRATALATLIAASPALRAREREILARYATSLRDRLAADSGARPGDLRPAVAADAIIAVHQAVIAGHRAGLLAGEPTQRLSRRMRAAATEAFELLGRGLSGFGPVR